jgi:hypothetical protein
VPGPAPKPQSKRARRNPTIALKQLPAEGRGSRRAPNFPLPADTRAQSLLPVLRRRLDQLEGERFDEQDGRRRRSIQRQIDEVAKEIGQVEAETKAVAKLEREIWTQLWRTPMATQWEKQRWTREVAQYARHKARAELLGDLKEAKAAVALADRLGLTPWSLLRLRWEIAPATPPTGDGLAPVVQMSGSSDALDDFR